MSTNIRKIGSVKTPGNRKQYLAFFREVKDEYEQRAELIEQRLTEPTGKWTAKTLGRFLDSTTPSWEIQDVFHFTDVSPQEVQQVLPPMITSMIRLRYAEAASLGAQHFRKSERATIQASGNIEAILATYADRKQVEEECLRIVEGWMREWWEPCRVSSPVHFSCQLPIAGSPEDFLPPQPLAESHRAEILVYNALTEEFGP